jgi:DNA polymerase I-like protein with 3'-5' exonuclease and polymerase domains
LAETLINVILLHRDQAKSLQVLETEIDNDWRWRCSYNIGGTTTGRFSSSKSPFGTGNNFQNIAEQLRRVFIPDPGFKLYGIDKAQSEARDVGWFCGIVLGDWSYLDACESGDLHTYVTRLVYPDWDWTGDLRKDRQIAERRFYRLFTFRDASKRLGHGTNYLGSPAELSRQIRIPLPLVKEFQARYFTAFPCINQMHAWISQQIQRERYLVNSFGRRRDIFDRPDTNDTLKAAVAYMFQSATGDALNLGMLRLWHRFRGGPIQLLSQLHDAVYFQMPVVPEKEEKDLLTQALDCVQITQTCPTRSMTIPGEIVGGHNWAHRFKLSEDGTKIEWNPRGLDGIRL